MVNPCEKCPLDCTEVCLMPPTEEELNRAQEVKIEAIAHGAIDETDAPED